jgi:TPR repeat protein
VSSTISPLVEGQKRLRQAVGRLVPDLKAGHIAEAIAAGYGFKTHAALLAALDAGKAFAATFDGDRFTRRLAELGAADVPPVLVSFICGIAEAELMPRGHVRRPEPAADCERVEHAVRLAKSALDLGVPALVAGLVGGALPYADAAQKRLLLTLLEQAAPASPGAAVNLAIALLNGDGVPAEPIRAESLFRQVLAATDDASESTHVHAHNWLGHIERGAFGKRPDPDASVAHFEAAARLGHREAAFNAALHYQHPTGRREDIVTFAGTAQDAKARELYELAASLGHPGAMTNLGLMILGSDPDRAVTLLERAAELGDPQAQRTIAMIDRSMQQMWFRR